MSIKKGIASYITILIVLGGGLSIMLAFSFFILNELKGALAASFSMRSLYAAESGLEDALLRLRPGQLPPPSNYGININDSNATVSVSTLIGATRTITSEGLHNRQAKKISIQTALAVTKTNFFYGAQIGEGGLVMGNNAVVNGSVFSDGNILGSSGATVTDTAKVANNGNSIDTLIVGADAHAFSLQNCTVAGKIYYVSGGSVTACTAGNGIFQQATEIASVPLPVSSSTIQAWKDDAVNGGIIGALSIPNNATQTRGPVKINGNLTLGNNSVLNMAGVIWVTGNLIMGNNSIIKLDPSYGTLSGVIVFDGKVEIKNNGQLFGTGATSSFLMAVSESASLDPNNPAIDIFNSAAGAVFYTNTGLIVIHNTVAIYEAVGYKLQLDNNGTINYQSGLYDVSFTSGPSGSWNIFSWQEIP